MKSIGPFSIKRWQMLLAFGAIAIFFSFMFAVLNAYSHNHMQGFYVLAAITSGAYGTFCIVIVTMELLDEFNA